MFEKAKALEERLNQKHANATENKKVLDQNKSIEIQNKKEKVHRAQMQKINANKQTGASLRKIYLTRNKPERSIGSISHYSNLSA